MISIIICSINPSLLKQVSKNIEETIGLPFEIIAIDNQMNKYGICEAYNQGAEKSNFEYLCFVHEDILFHTLEWGRDLINLLNIDNIGLAGVAGATYKSKVPASWISVPTEYYRTNALSNMNNKLSKHINNPENNIYSEVAVLDGFFLTTTKTNWGKIKFNQSYLKGFHLYDLDYSIKQEKKVVVSHQILIEHMSGGNFGKDWIEESIRYHHNNIKESLSLKSLSQNEKKKLDLIAAQSLFITMITKGYSISASLKILFVALRINFKNKKNWRLLLSFLSSIVKRVIHLFVKFFKNTNKSIIDKYLRLNYNGVDFCIISNNCWAGNIYQALKKPYNTPFVGLFINAADYIELLKDFDYIINTDLKFQLGSKYPIKNINYPVGVLKNNIEIHFLHYKTEFEAYEKWNRRKKRMLKDINRIFVKFDDRDFFEENHIYEFHDLPYKNKISFTKNKYDGLTENIKLKNRNDMILLYSTRGLLDIAAWLNRGIIKNSFMNKFINSLFSYPKTWETN